LFWVVLTSKTRPVHGSRRFCTRPFVEVWPNMDFLWFTKNRSSWTSRLNLQFSGEISGNMIIPRDFKVLSRIIEVIPEVWRSGILHGLLHNLIL
jgi:hypothetical protein